MENLRIIFTDGGTIFSQIVKTVTRGKWSHCGLIDDTDPENLKVLDTAFCQGVKEFEYKEYMKKVWNHETITLECTPKQKEFILRWSRSKLGRGYDIRIFFAYILRSEMIQSSEKYICSEFIAIPLVKQGIIDLGDHREKRVNPTCLYWICRTIQSRSK